MNNVKLDGPELWEIVFSATQGGGDEITESQYSDIAETINAVFIASKDAEIARLRQIIGSIADDFHPDRDADAPLAIQEMRDDLASALKENADADRD